MSDRYIELRLDGMLDVLDAIRFEHLTFSYKTRAEYEDLVDLYSYSHLVYGMLDGTYGGNADETRKFIVKVDELTFRLGELVNKLYGERETDVVIVNGYLNDEIRGSVGAELFDVLNFSGNFSDGEMNYVYAVANLEEDIRILVEHVADVKARLDLGNL